ncbi:MAG: SH3 domain-containing protein, partial [Desulfobacterales bacterium]
MENHTGKWIICSLIIVMGMGCASKEPTPEAPVMESIPAMAPRPEPEKEKVVVAASRLNLRSESTTKSQILHVLNQGEALSVLERSEGWIKVQTDTGMEGWVSARYTTATDTAAASTLDAAAPAIVPEQNPTKPPTVTEKRPKSPAKKSAKASPKTTDSTSAQTGTFTQEAAVAAYSRFRQALMDGDFEAFLDAIHDPPGPEEVDPQEFAQMKGFFLEMMPDPAAWEVLKFALKDDTALLVSRSDLDNPESITLNPLFFIAHNGKWKVKFDVSPETLPRQDPQTDQTNIVKALNTNPKLQLSGAATAQGTQTETSVTQSSSPPQVAAIPSQNGVAAGEMVINGEATKLKYAYAHPEAGFSDPDRMDTIAILSNMELDYEALSSWARRSELEDIGKLFCIELTINPDNQVISRRLRHHVFDGSPSGVSSSEVFEPQEAGQGIIAGQAYSRSEGEFFGITYQYRVAFKAEIKKPVEPAQTNQGTQAASYTITPPSKEDLTRVPRYMKDMAEPVFKTMDARSAVSWIKVVSNRNTAVIGFNTPEVVVYLPPFGNSAYA